MYQFIKLPTLSTTKTQTQQQTPRYCNNAFDYKNEQQCQIYDNMDVGYLHDSEYLFTGYASVFNNIDSNNDVILPNAFLKTIANLKKYNTILMLLLEHNQRNCLGYIQEIYENDFGLFVEIKLFHDMDNVSEIYNKIKSGILKGLSIGYKASHYTYDLHNATRYIEEIDIYEISLVTIPENPLAVIHC